MNHFDDRIKLDVFNSQSTYQSDYKKLPLESKSPYYSPKTLPDPSAYKKTKKIPYRDNETFVQWRDNVTIPFDLLWRPNEITRNDPYKPFKKPDVPKVKEDETVIKTRPRVYMSPAISLDDVNDPEMRKFLISNMYTTESARAIQESHVHTVEKHILNTTIEESVDPVRLKIDLFPPLPEEFRQKAKGKDWENSQMKYCVDPTKTFWEYKDPPVKCGACHDPVAGLVPDETKELIADLIRRNKLRLAHDVPIPGYAGYKPRLSYGVSLEKKE